MDVLKQCRDCGERKPLAEFWAGKASPDGRARYCKPCFKLRNDASAARRAKRSGRAYRPRASARIAVADGLKRCPRCQQSLPLDVFVRNRSVRDGIGSYCRPCQNAKAVESIARNPGSTRHYHLMQRYGIGADTVDEMLATPGGSCALCRLPLSSATAHVDHDHRTGRVRSILCFNCNGGLGQFKDEPTVLRRAANYVEPGVAPERTATYDTSWADGRWRTGAAGDQRESPLDAALRAMLESLPHGRAS